MAKPMKSVGTYSIAVNGSKIADHLMGLDRDTDESSCCASEVAIGKFGDKVVSLRIAKDDDLPVVAKNVCVKRSITT